MHAGARDGADLQLPLLGNEDSFDEPDGGGEGKGADRYMPIPTTPGNFRSRFGDGALSFISA